MCKTKGSKRKIVNDKIFEKAANLGLGLRLLFLTSIFDEYIRLQSLKLEDPISDNETPEFIIIAENPDELV